MTGGFAKFARKIDGARAAVVVHTVDARPSVVAGASRNAFVVARLAASTVVVGNAEALRRGVAQGEPFGGGRHETEAAVEAVVAVALLEANFAHFTSPSCVQVRLNVYDRNV